MKHILYRHGHWAPPLLLLLLLLLIAAPARAADQTRQQQQVTTTSLNANIYLTTEGLKAVFQDKINQQIGNLSNDMMTKMLGNLPSADRGWAKDMAGALIQPSATLQQLIPQKNGLAATVNLSLFAGDPKPISTTMLITFSVRDASTIQVSAQSLSGSASGPNGPLTTFPIPIGTVNSINTTPNCGNAALDANIQLPVTIDTSQTSTQGQNNSPPPSGPPNIPNPSGPSIPKLLLPHPALSTGQTQADTTHNQAANTLNVYAEIPNSSLSALGSSIGSMPIDNMWTAQNLRIKTQNNGLMVMADISFRSTGVVVGTATSYIQPSAENGKLVMHVTSTTLNVGIVSFPLDIYNQRIESMLNSDLSNAFPGNFTANSVGVGGGTGLPCAGSDSLIVQGLANMS
jgi:hypothetical protein